MDRLHKIKLAFLTVSVAFLLFYLTFFPSLYGFARSNWFVWSKVFASTLAVTLSYSFVVTFDYLVNKLP